MPKLEIKKIKGKKYLYLKDRVKVNDKTLPLTIYIGRLGKVTPDQFLRKLSEYQIRRLKTFTEYWWSGSF